MEGIALILIGTAIFSHSWHLLGLYTDGRTVGVIMAGLALGLLLSLFTFQPQFLSEVSANGTIQDGAMTSLRTLIVIWAIYAGVVAAQGLWDMEDRALGFYSVLLTVAGIVILLFFLQVWIDGAKDVLMLPLVISSAMLSLVGALQFFQMAFPFPALRSVTGWAMLIQSIVIVGIGMAMITTVIA